MRFPMPPVPRQGSFLGNLIGIVQIAAFVATAVWAVANISSTTADLRESVSMLRSELTDMSVRLIKLETKFDDAERRRDAPR